MNMADWLNLAGMFGATFIGAWLGYLAAGRQEREREAKLGRTLRQALLAEFELCTGYATTYLSSGILAPAYRLPSTVYDGNFSQLVATGEIGSADAAALLHFYSQVRQVNWCLDEIHRHLHAGDLTKATQERNRLVAKLLEMSAPASRFYDPALKALHPRTPSRLRLAFLSKKERATL